MFENFTRIPEEEQRRILAACIEEFAQHGYAGASTNTIVKNAGIPKGTLFFYFGSKKGVYFYIIDRAIESYRKSFLQNAGELPAELFERLLYLGRERLRFAVREPVLYRLLFSAFVNLPPEIQAEMQSRYAGYQDAGLQLIYKDLDRSRFREGVDVERAVAMVYLLMEGIYNSSLAELKRLSPEQSLVFIEGLTGEVQQYFEMIKRGVYRD